jgi:hypothetical protein
MTDINIMENKQSLTCRHYLTYSGVDLPLKLVTPLDEEDLENRLTFFRGYFDAHDQLMAVEKVVYGEIEFEHRYQYHGDGRLKIVELIEEDEEPRVMQFD